MTSQAHQFANSFNFLRHLAATQVLLVHACHHFEYQSGLVDLLELFPGVPIFFCISGYLIGQSYLSLREPVLKQFAWRRSLRIFPALWCVVVFAAVLPILIGYLDIRIVSTAGFWAWIAAQASIVQFYNPEFLRGFGVGSINGALWTISVELSFYILTPVLIYMMRRSMISIALVVLISVSVNVYIHNFVEVPNFVSKLIRASFVPWISTFIFGCILAFSDKARKAALNLPAVPLLVAYIASMFLIGDVEANSSNAINPISTLLLVLLTIKFGESSRVYRLCGKHSIWKNDLSYGIYIWHMPIINALLFLGLFSLWGNIILTVLLTFALAGASWFLVERPALSLKNMIGPTVPRT